ncbi:MAG: lamin tail domain-containing protein [Verrucomicrobia bacterium]|nr:lamin tail domain-containing protein [Verrucomicrobiota bacterium]
MNRLAWMVLLLTSVLLARADSVVVFNEIMYHPPTNEAALEWVELHNQMAVDVDLSGWSLRGGIDFDFPEGTVFAAGGYLVVAVSPASLVATTGLTNVLGPFTGRLANGGEKLELRNNNQRVMDAVNYSVEGDWPVAPDGAGPSLAKLDEESASAPASNWRASTQLGGTPGTANTPKQVLMTTTRTLVPISQIWKYEQSGADLGTAWITTNFNDSAWLSGPALLADETCGCLPEPIRTPLTVGVDKTTFYFRTTFTYSSNVANASLSLRHVVDDGLIVYLNGVEAYRIGMPTGAVTSATTSSRSVGDAVYEGPFSIPATSLLLGTNVLAVEVHQQATNSTDVTFGLQLDDSFTVTNSPAQALAAVPSLAFNEMSSVTNAQFWIEIINTSTQSVVLDHYVLARFGTTNREFVLSAAFIPAGGYLVLDRALLGFGADPGDQVVLYTPGKSNVIDAVIAKSFPRARWPEATGPWLHPTELTPGATNVVTFHDEIVINEILYQARQLPAVPAVYFTNLLLTITNNWRYDQSGTNFGPEWTAPDFDDSAWLAGRAVFYTNITTLPAPKGTTLALSNAAARAVTNYYFRTAFVFTNSPVGVQLALNPIIDDGAIFYLNGEEIYRYAMPAGAVSATTRAITNIGVPGFSGPVIVPADHLVVGTNLLAVEVHQYLPPPGSKDIAFAAELVARGFVSLALPSRESPESWLELFNRSTNTVDLTGWRLDDGIDFRFAPGTSLPAGGFLVVAKEPMLVQSNHPGVTVLGPFTNQLSRGGERIALKDAAGNPADEVCYFDARPWPAYANGFGSSLELRDPRADNAKPEAWAASDQSGLSTWQTYTYRGLATAEPAASPTVWNEFILGLLGEGEVWLDDIKVIEAPNGARRQLIQNGSFESGLAAWRTIGTHRFSEVIVDPANASNHILHLVATGDTEHRHNQASTTLTNNTPIVNGVEYEISFRAKWIAGCNKLNSRLYFNRLARTTVLAAPDSHGTPGAPNSRRTPNLGPTFSNLRHEPVVPAASQPVTISVAASDPDGVTNATLFYSVNGGPWQTTPMTFYVSRFSFLVSATVAPQPAGSLVQFYVRATDTLGAAATYPAAGANSRALYKVPSAQPLAARLHTLRLLMTAADAALLHAPTNVMSNEPWGCTVIYDDREVFYDATLHLQASERGRNVSTRVGFTVSLPAGQALRGVHRGFTLDRSGGYSGKGGRQDEMLLKHAINKAGQLPCMYDDLVQVYAPRASEDSTALLLMAKFNSEFLDTQFKDGGDGEMYKLELIYYPTTTANGDVQGPKLPQPDLVVGTDIKDLGLDAEAYRWTFLKENHVARDNYGPMMTLAQTLSLTGTNFHARIQQVMDVDEWARAVAFLCLIGGNDMYTYGNSHNLIVYFRPEDGKGMAFNWDLDYSFVAATDAAFPGTGSPNTSKLFTNPDTNRRFYNHLYDLSAVTGDSAYMTRWANHYAGLVGQNWSAAVTYLAQRAAYVRGTMPLGTAFAIANNGGNHFAVNSSRLALSGTAPMSVRDIEVNGLRYPLTWTSLTTWTLTVPLPAYTNTLTVRGFDADGTLLANATDSIIVTNLSTPALLPVVINEWMADNAGPGGFPDPADGQFQDWFELFNPNAAPVDLSGYFLSDTILFPNKWTLPTNTVIAPRGFILVWADENGTQNGTGTNGDLHANFKLSGTGEALGLFAPDGTPQHAVTFGAQFQNVSQGLFPDGDTNAVYSMTNWTPRATNRLGTPPPPEIADGTLVVADGAIAFSLPAWPGRAYRVDFKDDLGFPLWLPLSTNRTDNGVILIHDDTAGRAQRFYRVVLLP